MSTVVAMPRGRTEGQRPGQYPDYRATGLDWLPVIPQHWSMEKLKYIAQVQFSNVDKKSEVSEVPVRLCNYVDVYYHDRITSEIEFMEATADPREIAKFQVQPGDVLATKDSEDPNDICVPAVVGEPLPGVLCGYHLAQVRPLPGISCGGYIMRAFASCGVRDQFRKRANGITRFGLSQDAVCSALIPVPPLEEQEAIAKWLDDRAKRIDELVAAKRRLMDLLAEQRTALIAKAVTKGLDPAAPMKPSGIDWLGNVPRHWEIRPLKYAVTFQRGHDLPSEERSDGEVPVVTSAGPSAWHDRAAAQGPGIVTGRYGTIGVFHLVNGPYWPLNTTLYSINLHGNNPDFLRHMLHTLKPVFLLNAAKSAVPGVDRNDLHPIPVAVPSRAEQDQIAHHLDIVERRTNELATAAATAIDKLQEYRQALITAAVTGKIDVRRNA
ncbi:EcoKI restriction-modification system protein HsdS [Phycisphaerae bacterium RAS2]|nr:EcoKI restriction-modification system protein HsdS [Phycisphaerae bacterium RAS2]